jgi:hypothetical protein
MNFLLHKLLLFSLAVFFTRAQEETTIPETSPVKNRTSWLDPSVHSNFTDNIDWQVISDLTNNNQNIFGQLETSVFSESTESTYTHTRMHTESLIYEMYKSVIDDFTTMF